MPPDPSKPPELSGAPDLPRFADRLPDLTLALKHGAESLSQSHPQQSYIPYWEDMYAAAHSIKGVLGILACPPELGTALQQLSDILVSGLSGPLVCRRNSEAASALLGFAEHLDAPDLGTLKLSTLERGLRALQGVYEPDVAHDERIKTIPSHLFYVNEFVSKKAREVDLLGLNHCVVEEEILLDEIPWWRTQLLEALNFPEGGRGLVVNFLPFLSSEGSRKLKVWAWVAGPTHSRAALKMRVKELLPKVMISKL